MTINARNQYLEVMRTRYRQAPRADRSQLLTEICQTCGYSRKHAIRVVNGSQVRAKRNSPPSTRGRPKVYALPEILEFLKCILRGMNLACSKRMQAAIPLWLPYYEEAYDVVLDETIHDLLQTISASTIDRLLAHVRQGGGKLGLATTKPGSLLKNQIPVRKGCWDESRPGYLEADTVAHCGTSVEGQFVYTINTVDIATGWSEQRACWGKGQTGIRRAVADIEQALPFPLRGFDCDNGSEFINWHLFGYLHSHRGRNRVQFTRGREGYPNDNAHIEEKNWTIVRQYLGYERFDNQEVLPLLNALYRGPWRLFINGFLPSVKLVEKHRVGARVVRHYDKPQTPLERILTAPSVPKKKKDELQNMFKNLNPFHLQQKIVEAVQTILTRAVCTNPACPFHSSKE
jgi:hypothetical protein